MASVLRTGEPSGTVTRFPDPQDGRGLFDHLAAAIMRRRKKYAIGAEAADGGQQNDGDRLGVARFTEDGFGRTAALLARRGRAFTVFRFGLDEHTNVSVLECPCRAARE